jgi:two-component system, OmpR family, sensor kinase
MATRAETAEAARAASRLRGRGAVVGTSSTGLRGAPWSLRIRLVAWFIGVLTLALLASVFVTRQVLHVRLDQRIDRELNQEAAELRALARGNDPATGEPFGERVRRIFQVYLQRNIASRHEMFVTFAGGTPHLYSPADVPYRLDRDPELVARWGRVAVTRRGHVETPEGRVEYQAVPLLRRDGGTAGVFVAAIFRDQAAEDTDAAIRAAAAVGLVFILLSPFLAWRLASGVVEPLAGLTRMARGISDTDLTRRIPVGGRDEVSQLAATFNEMLDRLEHGFGAQREFLDDAGHELRTPLTIIRGHLELLGDDPLERQETLALVSDELDRMARMVDDLLLLAKQEQPDFLDLSTVDVGLLTDELYAKLAALAPSDWFLDERGSGVIVADRHRLTQALLQLAENAVRHSAPEDPLALGSSVDAREARLWIRDHGPGVPAYEQAAIFERFSRSPADRRWEGAGLGLAIVKAIAEAHHGRVELSSRPGEGAVFTIVVPLDGPAQGDGGRM